MSAIGTGMTGVALAIQVWGITGSSFAVGAIGLATMVPTLALGLLGGSIADAVDRRRLVLATSLGLTLVAALLAVQAVLDLRQLWLLYLLAAAQSGLSAVDAPARRTFAPRLLPPALIPAAAALTHLGWQVSALVGPLVAGSLLADLNAMVLAMPAALFPALADARFGGGEATAALLYAAIGLGGLVAGVLSGPLGRIRHQGAAMLVAVGAWGAAMVGLGVSPALGLGVVCLVVAGAADVVTVVLRGSILQLTTPDALRGRIGGVDFVVGAGGPQLGNARAGAVAAVVGPAASAAFGGVACVLGAIGIAAAIPAVRRYRVESEGG
ncbi:hypothetical protein GCM10009539_66350 [Cryptosporangium japonicum]|uniref:Major facilitator superfamily (MFS) profile domain-containing protein n=1 Tax=Cryptosporangium japonicum TaxID=80872 RepID=A0ABN0V107_9ACTN